MSRLFMKYWYPLFLITLGLYRPFNRLLRSVFRYVLAVVNGIFLLFHVMCFTIFILYFNMHI